MRICRVEMARHQREELLLSKGKLVLRKMVHEVWERGTGSWRGSNALLALEMRRVGQRKRSRVGSVVNDSGPVEKLGEVC